MPASVPSNLQRIFLMGFMGAGKTTTGKLLAGLLGWRFVDLDAAVEARCGSTVPQIFAHCGEHGFRAEESAALHTLVDHDRLVLALGGGTVEHRANQSLLRENAHSVLIYLRAPFTQLQKRCLLESADSGSTVRPLLADPAVAERRFDERRPIFESLANLQVDTSDLTPAQVAQRILSGLVEADSIQAR